MVSKRVVITGGSGFIGRALGQYLSRHDYQVIALSRNPAGADMPAEGQVQRWDGQTGRDWAPVADGTYAIINLAGENVAAGKWSDSKKQSILESRVNAGHAVAEAISLARNKPRVLIQASAIGYYGNRGEQILDEDCQPGQGFLAQVCRQWEQTAQAVKEKGVRTAVIRIGLVLGKGGFLEQILPMFKKFLGGCPGKGRQYVSWVHIDDVVAAIGFLLDKEDAGGPYNFTAPQPLPAKEFYRLLGRTINRPTVLPIPARALKFLMGQMAEELMLIGQRVLPEKLQRAGYVFKFADVERALNNLLSSDINK